jgi:hypothetical protein
MQDLEEVMVSVAVLHEHARLGGGDVSVGVGVLRKHVRLVGGGGVGKGERLVQVIENEVEELSAINRTLNDPHYNVTIDCNRQQDAVPSTSIL